MSVVLSFDSMSLIVYRVLFFCLVPLGIFILVKAILMLRGIFSGKVMAEIPLTAKDAKFEISKPGVYAVWLKGSMFKRTPVDKFALELLKEPSGQHVDLPRSLFSPYVNGFDSGRMEMNRFSAEVGVYRLKLVEGSQLSGIESLFTRLFPTGKVDYSKFFLQVRESKPIYYIIAGIPLIMLSIACIFGGLVSGFLAPSILTELGIHYIN